MFKSKITGNDGREWAGVFETEILASEWLEKQKKKPGRLPQREVVINVDDPIPSDAISHDYEIVNDEIVGHRVVLPAQATYEVLDVSEEVEFRKNVEVMMKAMDLGKYIIAGFSVRNMAKNLTKGQIKQLSQDLAPLQSLALSGSIDTLRTELENYIPDGILVTQSDLDWSVSEINRVIGQ